MDPKIRERLESYLLSKGLRRTKPRDIIVEAAFSTTEHFTAEELLDMARKIDRTVSRATVYRTLSLLVECELLHEIDLGRDDDVLRSELPGEAATQSPDLQRLRQGRRVRGRTHRAARGLHHPPPRLQAHEQKHPHPSELRRVGPQRRVRRGSAR